MNEAGSSLRGYLTLGLEGGPLGIWPRVPGGVIFRASP